MCTTYPPATAGGTDCVQDRFFGSVNAPSNPRDKKNTFVKRWAQIKCLYRCTVRLVQVLNYPSPPTYIPRLFAKACTKNFRPGRGPCNVANYLQSRPHDVVRHFYFGRS